MNKSLSEYGEKDLDFLLSPLAIRQSAEAIFELTLNNKTHFTYHPEKFDGVVDYVIEVIRDNYPTLDIPFHSRWGHFRVGGINRVTALDEKLKSADLLERARTKLDLVITSVLLDAGAGAEWSFKENFNGDSSGKSFNRSEGLGVASFYLFMNGSLSHEGKLQATTG